MRCFFSIIMFFAIATCKAQEWYGELTIGGASYNGDLTQKALALSRVKPMAGFNLKYNTGDFINFRLGLTYAKLGADDKNNRQSDLRSRNLNFQTNLFELNVCAELCVLDPENYYSYPYLFVGAGVFHFNPYTFDSDNKKTFLQPLGTEGQGLPGFKKKYSLYQACFPFGGGFKLNLQHRYEISWELGYRLISTDYLDDVSKRYVSLKTLAEESSQKAAELSYRKDAPFKEEGEKRGNSSVRDSYFFTGLKFAIRIGGSREDNY